MSERVGTSEAMSAAELTLVESNRFDLAKLLRDVSVFDYLSHLQRARTEPVGDAVRNEADGSHSAVPAVIRQSCQTQPRGSGAVQRWAI
jgi:hypothetical protein